MELLRLIENIRSPFLDVVIGVITSLGEETFVVAVICAMFWCINKRATYITGVVFFLSGLTVQGMKICFQIERPWVIDPSFSPVPSALEHATGYSFPSGHTQSATALFGSLGAIIKRKPIKALCFIVVVLVAFSRLYLGVHTLPDVAASVLFTLLIIFLTVKLRADDAINKRRELIGSFLMVLYAVAAIVLAAVLYSGGRIEMAYLSDCLKAAGAGVGFAVGMYVERVYIDFSVRAKNMLWQVIKFILGIAGVLAIQEGLKLVIGTGLAVDTIRYFIMIMWILVFYPLIIKRFFSVVNNNQK